jgi:hypothetical protein
LSGLPAIGCFPNWLDSDGLVAEELLPLINREGIPYLDAHGTPQALAQASDWKIRVNLRPAEEEAYTLLLVGEPDQALDLLEETCATHVPVYDWEVEVIERMRGFAEILRRSPEEAIAQLKEWRTYTLDHLNIPVESRAEVG